MECSACGSSNVVTANFCANCGHRLKAPTDTGGGAERRQISVMFCDLVGSTPLSEQLDPEDLTTVILAYRSAVRDIATDLGGYVARYVGDGILIYFGYPHAQEDDAVRAVRAGLRIVQEIGTLAQRLKLPVMSPLQSHIGIHTGLVVVGDIGSGPMVEHHGVVGETPNVAARIEKLAPPDTVLISGATYDLVAFHFRCMRLESQRIEGISRAVDIYRVDEAMGRLIGLEGQVGDSIPLVDRTVELGLLRDGWARAKRRNGGLFVLSGEPGVGKSRLTRNLTAMATGDGGQTLSCYCSRENANSAFFPVIQMARAEFGLGPTDERKDAYHHLVEALDEMAMPDDAVDVLAAFLPVPLPPGVEPLRLSPEGLRQRVMEVLMLWFYRRAEERPVLFVLEDLHWADASTLEWLELVSRNVMISKLMIVLTMRSDASHLLAPLSNAREIALERLPPDYMLQLCGLLTETRALPDSLRHQVVERSDGIPLFLEEQVKTIYETVGAIGLADAGGRDVHEDLDIPRSLHGLLTARLDRLTVGKTIAQIAAVIGREFPISVLSGVALMSREQLNNGLRELTQSDIIYPSSIGAGTTYAFRHSLVHEAAYQIQLRSRRQDYHGQVARAYLTAAPRIVDTQPEIVAHHFERAGVREDSAHYWYLAGMRARAQSAYQEAASHFRKGLRQLEALPTMPKSLRDEIRITVALGSTLIATHGYAAPEVRTVYDRASELAEKSGQTHELIAALNGVLAYLQVRGPLSEAFSLATRIVELAKGTQDLVLIAGAYRRLGWCCFCYGRIAEGRQHLAHAANLYDPAKAKTYVDVHNADPGVLGSINLAWVEWFGGDIDRAREYSRRAREAARALDHPLSLAYALTMSAAVAQGLDDVEATHEFASEAIALSARNAFAYWRAWATTLQGWTMTRKGRLEAGLDTMLAGLRAYEETGAQLFKPYVLTLIADAYRMLGRYSEGLAFLDGAASCALHAEVRFYDAEILRIRGELLAVVGDSAEAERCYRQALELATSQGAGSLRARIETSLAGVPRGPIA